MIDPPGLVDLRFIGQGGLGAVYRAYQPEFDRFVAVKVLNASSHDPELLASFDRECASAGRIAWHPNVATVFSRGTIRGRPFLVMEYYPAGSLMEEIAAHGAMGAEEVTALGLRLASALEAAHEAGILHRDVKPQNVLLSSLGEPALADFGLAQLAWSTQSSISGGFTPAFAAPETFQQEPASTRADLYSLAATLYCLAAGHPPFGRPGQSISAVIGDVLEGHARPFPESSEYAPLRELIERSMRVDPGERPASVADFAEELRAIQEREGFDESARREPATRPSEEMADADQHDDGVAGDGPPGSSTRRLVGGIVVSSLVALALLITVIVRDRDDSAAVEPDATSGSAGAEVSTARDPCEMGEVTPQLSLVLDAIEIGNDVGTEHEDRAVLPTECMLEVPAVRAAQRLGRIPDSMAALDPGPVTQMELRAPGFAPAAVAYASSNRRENEPCWVASIDYAVITDNSLGIWTSPRFVAAASLFSFSDTDDARAAFVANSLARGASGEECTGFGEDRVAQFPDDADIHYEDFAVEVEGVSVNTRLHEGILPYGYDQIPDATLYRVVARRGADVLMLDLAALDPATVVDDVDGPLADLVGAVLDDG